MGFFARSLGLSLSLSFPSAGVAISRHIVNLGDIPDGTERVARDLAVVVEKIEQREVGRWICEHRSRPLEVLADSAGIVDGNYTQRCQTVNEG